MPNPNHKIIYQFSIISIKYDESMVLNLKILHMRIEVKKDENIVDHRSSAHL
jgi:hypothetical protein